MTDDWTVIATGPEGEYALSAEDNRIVLELRRRDPGSGYMQVAIRPVRPAK